MGEGGPGGRRTFRHVFRLGRGLGGGARASSTGGLDVFGVKVDHVAGREGRCGRAVAGVVSRHIVLRLGQHRLGFFEGVFHPVCELVNCFDVGRRLMWFEAHPRVLAGIEEEGGLLRGGVDMVVVGELCQREECVPVVLSFSDEEP